MLKSKLYLPRYPEIFICPLLCHRSPLLLRLRDRLPSLNFAAEHDIAETFTQSITFWFQESKRVAEFFWQHEF